MTFLYNSLEPKNQLLAPYLFHFKEIKSVTKYGKGFAVYVSVYSICTDAQKAPISMLQSKEITALLWPVSESAQNQYSKSHRWSLQEA